MVIHNLVWRASFLLDFKVTVLNLVILISSDSGLEGYWSTLSGQSTLLLQGSDNFAFGGWCFLLAAFITCVLFFSTVLKC